ncbi:MAG: hypothetical protein RLZZ196_1020 [Bacteroidota bacterium]
MKRVFTFGCSFTGYNYPTWADILIYELELRNIEGYNFGRSGAGNLYITCKLWEANAKFQFTKDDEIYICWTDWNREDRYVNNRGWLTPGNLGSQDSYDEAWLKKWQSGKFSVIRDCTLIKSTQLALKQLGVNTIQFSMAPVIQPDPKKVFFTWPDQIDVLKTFNLQFDCPPMMEFINTMCQQSKDIQHRILIKHDTMEKAIHELHPLPDEHFAYINQYLKNKISWLDRFHDDTIKFVNNWTARLKNCPPPVLLDSLGWKSKRPKTEWN